MHLTLTARSEHCRLKGWSIGYIDLQLDHYATESCPCALILTCIFPEEMLRWFDVLRMVVNALKMFKKWGKTKVFHTLSFVYAMVSSEYCLR